MTEQCCVCLYLYTEKRSKDFLPAFMFNMLLGVQTRNVNIAF